MKFFIGFCLALILIFQPGNMLFKNPSVEKAYAATTITKDYATVADAPSGGTLQWTHTTGSESNMILLVDIETRASCFGSGSGPVTGVSYSGKSLTKLTYQTDPTEENLLIERWYLTAPAPGSNMQIAVTLDPSYTCEVIGGSSTYYNVDQINPFGMIATVDGSSVTLPINSASQLLVDTIANIIVNTCGACSPPKPSGNVTPLSGQTVTWNWSAPSKVGDLNAASSYKQPGTPKDTIGWNGGWVELATLLNQSPTSLPTGVSMETISEGGSLDSIGTHTTRSLPNQLLVVELTYKWASGTVTDNIAYNGTNLTKKTAIITPGGFGVYSGVELWYMLNPPAGTHNITVSMNGSSSYAIQAMTYYNVDQTSPFGTLATNSGGSIISPSPASVQVTDTPSQLITEMVVYNDPGLSPGSPTNASQVALDDAYSSCSTGCPTIMSFSIMQGQSTSPVTLGWSPSSQGWAELAIPINQAPLPTGNITNLDFGITNNVPWFQAFCADIRQESNGGINDFIPASPSCGGTATTNMIMSNATCPNPANSGNGSNGNTNNIPGIAFTGDNSAYFGQGQASTNPFDCVVGGIQYSEVFTPVNSTVIRTSYDYMQTTARQSGLTPTDIAPYCTGGIGNCTLSNILPHGLYQATGTLTLTGPGYTFGANQDYVILVNGDLTIQEPIHVPAGSTVTFSVAGDIHVDKSVGKTTLTSLTPDIEGLYSTDKSFFIDSYGQPGSVCNANGTPIDKKLNIQGAVVVNAAKLGGTFQNNRNLCNQNPSCPTFTVTSRPDMLLNAPQFIKHQQSLWQEIIP